MNAHAQLPRLVQCVERPHLIDKLREAATHDVMLVCAPPGYGKSTTVAQFLEQEAQPVAWYTLDSRDRDGFMLDRQFRRHLSAAVGEDIAQPGYMAGGQELATELTDRLRNQFSTPLTLVLDDLHHIEGSASATALAQYACHEFTFTLPSGAD
jgi:LuxR family maltose regulon positive regulatory protein